MPISLAGYETLVEEAIRAFWFNRDDARTRQTVGGRTDRGERAGVTSGKNLDGFHRLVQAVVLANGGSGMTVQTGRRLVSLPGFFRPSKLWDALVLNGERLVATIEFKSHVGPSFGNNFNNRTEEALGSATDLWTAYREGAFGEIQRPFVGWMMLLEDCDGARSPVKDNSPNFPIREEFRGSSYTERYDLLCRKLVQEQLYSSACLVLTRREEGSAGLWSERSKLTGMRSFVAGLAAHVAAEVAQSST